MDNWTQETTKPQKRGLDPKGLLAQHLKDSVKEVPVQSYKLLHQCFHPCFKQVDNNVDNNLPKSDFVLFFEQQLCASAIETIETSTDSMVFEKDIISADEEKTMIKQYSSVFNLREISDGQLAPSRQNYGIQNEEEGLEEEKDEPLLQIIEDEPIKYWHQTTNTAKVEQEKSDTTKKLPVDLTKQMEPPRILESRVEGDATEFSTYKLSLQKVTGNDKQAQSHSSLISAMRFQVESSLQPLQDKIFFSQNGKIIFIILTKGPLEIFSEIILLDSQTLEQITHIKFGMSYVSTNGKTMRGSPQIIHVPQTDSYFICLMNNNQVEFVTSVDSMHEANASCYTMLSSIVREDDHKYEIQAMVFGYDDGLVIVTKETHDAHQQKSRVVCFLTNMIKVKAQLTVHSTLKLKSASIHTSTFDQVDMPKTFSIEQAFMQKDEGLYMVATDEDLELQTLIYASRSSISQAKEAKAKVMELEGFLIPQNPELVSELSFMIQCNSEHHFISSIDLRQNANHISEYVAARRHTYFFRDKKQMCEQSNYIDFINQSQVQKYYSFINVSNSNAMQTSEVTRVVKDKVSVFFQEHQQISKYKHNLIQFYPLGKIKLVNISPYMIVIEDRSVLQIYSIIDPLKSYRLELSSQYLSNIELGKGSLIIDNQVYYRHQLFIFLTKEAPEKKSEAFSIHVNCLVLPSYSDFDGSLTPLVPVKLYKLPFIIDSTKFHRQEVVKAYLEVQSAASEQSKNYTKYMSLIIQQRSRLLICGITQQDIVKGNKINKEHAEIYTSNVVQLIPTNSEVPIEISPMMSLKHSTFYVHCANLQGQQSINRLEMIFSKLIATSNHQTLNHQNKRRGSQYTSNHTSPIAKHRLQTVLDLSVGFQQKIISIKAVDEKQILLLTENLLVAKFKYSEKTKRLKMKEEWTMTQEAVQAFQKSRKNFLFTENALYTSMDFYLYISKTNRQREQFEKFENWRDKKAIGKKFKPESLFIGPIIGTDQTNIMYMHREYKEPPQNIFEIKQSRIQYLSFKESNDERDFTDELLMQCDIQLKLVIIPLHSERQFHLVHQDDFILDRVETTSFIGNEHILVKLKGDNKLLIFDYQGRLIKINQTIILNEFKLIQIQQLQKQTGLLFHLENTYMVIYLTNVGESYDITSKSIPVIPKQFSEYKKTILDRDGNVCSLLACNQANEEIIQFYINGSIDQAISDKISNIAMNPDIQEENQQSLTQRTTVSNSMHINSNQMGEKLLRNDSSEDINLNDYRFDFELVNNLSDGTTYLVFKDNLKIHLIKINSVKEPPIIISISFSEGYITQILQTQQANTIQFVYVSKSPLQYHIFTWDIKKNQEVNLLTFKATSKKQLVYVCRGISERANYFIPFDEEGYYDLRFQFPKNFMSGRLAGNLDATTQKFDEDKFKEDFDNFKRFFQQQINNTCGEYKLGKFEGAMLGVGKSQLLTLQFPNAYVNIQYAIYFITKFKELERSSTDEEMILFQPIMDLMRVTYRNENNIMHNFATKKDFLELFLLEIKNLVVEIEDKQALQYIYYALLPNDETSNHGRRPITLALKQNAPKCLEIMLQQLSLDSNQDYMRYVQDYLQQLLSLKSGVFNKFFEEQCHKELLHDRSLTSYAIKYKLFQTQYINIAKLRQIKLNKSHCNCLRKKPSVQKEVQNLEKIELKEIRNYDDRALSDDETIESQNQKHSLWGKFTKSFKSQDSIVRQSIFTSYDFEKIMTGRRGINFIKFISKQTLESEILELEPVHVYLDAQWQFLWLKYYIIVGLYFTVFLLQCYYYKVLLYLIREEKQSSQYVTEFFILYAILLPINFYLTVFELRRFLFSHMNKLLILAIYNLIQLLLMFTDLTVVLLDYNLQDSVIDPYKHLFIGLDANIVILGFIVFLIKIMQLNFAKLYLTRIYVVATDVAWLLFFTLLTQFVFAYSYYLISHIDSVKDDEDKLNYQIGWIFDGLAYFNENTFTELIKHTAMDRKLMLAGDRYYLILYAFLTVVVVCTNIYLSFFLIAAISDSYKNISQSLMRQKYLALAQILYENSILFDRDSVFKNTRYIIKEEAQRVQGDQKRDKKNRQQENMAEMITSRVKQAQVQESQRVELNYKVLRTKLDQLNSTQDAQDSTQAQIKQILLQMQRQLKDLEDNSQNSAPQVQTSFKNENTAVKKQKFNRVDSEISND